MCRLRGEFDLGDLKIVDSVLTIPGKQGDDVGYDVSEDCLTLNVIRPAGVSKDAELPVAVWIHGYAQVPLILQADYSNAH